MGSIKNPHFHSRSLINVHAFNVKKSFFKKNTYIYLAGPKMSTILLKKNNSNNNNERANYREKEMQFVIMKFSTAHSS